MHSGVMHRIYGGINVSLSEKSIEKNADIPGIGIIDKIEIDLEELSLKLLEILSEFKENGLINEAEYEHHVKIKRGFLNYLNEKRRTSTL